MGEGCRGESRISLSRRLSRRGLRSLVGVAKAFWSAGCEDEGGLLSMSARLLRVDTERESCEGARENAVSDLRLRANGDCDMLAFEKVDEEGETWSFSCGSSWPMDVVLLERRLRKVVR